MFKSLLMTLMLGALSMAGTYLQAQVGMNLPGAKHVVFHSRTSLSQGTTELTAYIDGQRVEHFVGEVPLGYRFVITEIEIQAAPANISLESSVEIILWNQTKPVFHTNGHLKAKPFGAWIAFHKNMSTGMMFPPGSTYNFGAELNNVQVTEIWLRGYYSPVPKTAIGTTSETLATTR